MLLICLEADTFCSDMFCNDMFCRSTKNSTCTILIISLCRWKPVIYFQLVQWIIYIDDVRIPNTYICIARFHKYNCSSMLPKGLLSVHSASLLTPPPPSANLPRCPLNHQKQISKSLFYNYKQEGGGIFFAKGTGMLIMDSIVFSYLVLLYILLKFSKKKFYSLPSFPFHILTFMHF